MSKFDVVVIGAGINGLASAYHLVRLGAGKVAVVEQFEAGHARGSSHGKSRITRSSYHAEHYAELIQQAHSEEWPRLSQDAGRELLHPTPGCFFGPGLEPYIDSVRAIEALADQVRILSAKEARKVFGQFLFPDSPQVIEDRTCAVVSAQETMEFLTQRVEEKATVFYECPVKEIESHPNEVRLHTERGLISCERLVVTAGSWTTRLLPKLTKTFTCTHQDVGYFEIEGGEEFPVWVFIPRQGECFYGLPEFGRPGVKVARHRTGSTSDRPERAIPTEIPESSRLELEQFVRQQFKNAARLVGYEACLYTNTVNEEFVIDHLAEDPRIVIGMAGSGHGFKFGPLTGRVVAELVLEGKTSVPVFEKYRHHFRIENQPSWPGPSL